MRHLNLISNVPACEQPTARELERIRRANAKAARLYQPPQGTPRTERHLTRDRFLGRLEGMAMGFSLCLLTVVLALALYIKLGA